MMVMTNKPETQPLLYENQDSQSRLFSYSNHNFVMSFLVLSFALIVPAAMAEESSSKNDLSVSAFVSYNCKKSIGLVHNKVCSDKLISKLDGELNATYKNIVLNGRNPSLAKKKQRQWVEYRNRCSDIGCIRRAYLARLFELSSDTVRSQPLSGQWHWERCLKSRNEGCSNFTVYLAQSGNVLCGSYVFSAPGLGRLSEGEQVSIVGFVSDSGIGEMSVTSGRSGSEHRVLVVHNNNFLNWEVVEEINMSVGFDSPLILSKGILERETEDSGYKKTIESCHKF